MSFHRLLHIILEFHILEAEVPCIHHSHLLTMFLILAFLVRQYIILNTKMQKPFKKFLDMFSAFLELSTINNANFIVHMYVFFFFHLSFFFNFFAAWTPPRVASNSLQIKRSYKTLKIIFKK